MKLHRKVLCVFLGLSLLLSGLTSCSSASESTETPLVIAADDFSRRFSPFFAESVPDMAIVDLVSPSLLTLDRTGAIIYNAIEGETVPYNNNDYFYSGPADISVSYDEASDKTTYRIKIRDDIFFSDGVKMTADDLIFTYYVLADPTYTGVSTFYSVDIEGLEEYRTQVSEASLEKYGKIFDGAITGVYDEGEYSRQEINEANSASDKAWSNAVEKIVDFVADEYGTNAYLSDYFTGTAENLSDNGFRVAYAMTVWGFGRFSDGTLTSSDNISYDISKGEYPDLSDFIQCTKNAYNNSLRDFGEAETEGVCKNPYITARNEFVRNISAASGDKQEEITRIKGIKKLSGTEGEVVTNGFDAAAVYNICGINVAPLHYYADKNTYDYENDKFGFTREKLDDISAKTAQPLGWGPYSFDRYENKIVYMKANENYYKGAPKIKSLQFKETAEADKISGLSTGVLDISNPSVSTEGFKEITALNSNGEGTGDKITMTSVDVLGYGYIGINAKQVCVAGDPSSEESKNLRKAIATILAVYRDLSIDSYYGETAKVINYPISSTSWASPRPSDSDYRVAYSLDVNGSEIYSPDMNASERYEAAKKAALGFFEAAGYTVENGKLTSAPEGASLEYEIIIGAGGAGNHPTFALLTAAKDALAGLGFTLTINDPSDANVMWDALNAGTAELWCAAWSASVDPDMYQIYHSSNVVGNGSGSNHYNISDPLLDEYITNARTSDDKNYRKGLYKECLDIILDWAVEIPVYQRQDTVLFSTERINTETLPKEITTYRGWTAEIEKLEMR